jgi:putative ABC transport system permease protein
MGMRVRAGPAFDHGRHDNLREALIDQHLAKQFFPTDNPLGAKIPFLNHSLTIVGVVKQARLYDVHQDSRPQLFIRAEDWAAEDNGFLSLSWVLRAQREPHTLIPEVRAAIRRVDSRLAPADLRTMDEIVDDALRQQRISAVLIASFALGALLLVAMGLFGVISGSVTRRRHELAVRLALGAEHPRVLRLVLGEGVRLVGVGVLIGVPGIYVAGGVLRGVLVGVSPSDPLTFLAVGLGLAVIAIVACYLPARRVLRIEPAQSLRQG